MFGAQIRLFRLAGFDVSLDVSWVFIALLISWTLATGYFPELHPGFDSVTYWSMGVVGAAGLFLSIVLHELAHSVVARRYGIRISGITLFIFGGVARMESEPPTARSEFMMAIAGPLARLALAAFFSVSTAAAASAGLGATVTGVLGYLAFINLVVAIFNMAPAFPLDGGRVYRAWLWGRTGDMAAATKRAALSGQIFGLVLVGLGVASLISGNVIAGLWWGLIGLFLHTASRASQTQAETQKLLDAETVERVMTPDPLTVPAGISLRELVDDHVYGSFHETFPVMENGAPVGTISVSDIRAASRADWAHLTVRDLMHPLSQHNTISPEEKTEAALRRMRESGHARLLVIDRGRLAGIVALRDIMRLVELKRELG